MNPKSKEDYDRSRAGAIVCRLRCERATDLSPESLHRHLSGCVGGLRLVEQARRCVDAGYITRDMLYPVQDGSDYDTN